MFVELIKLANQAKCISQYDLANCIFAVLLDQVFALTGEDREGTEHEPPKAVLMLETQDPDGEAAWEVYYDLLVIESYEYLGEGESGGYMTHRLNIPVPLIKFYPIVTAMKIASIVEREEHGREYRAPNPGEIDDLWAKFLSLVEAQEVESAIDDNLDFEDSEDGVDIELVKSRLLQEKIYV